MDVSEIPAATELLRRSEREAVLRWEAGVLAERPVATKISTLDEPIVAIPVPVAGKPLGDFTKAETLQAEKLRDPFGEFQALQVSLVPQSRMACITDSGSPAAEAFRLLGVRLRDLRRIRPLKTVLITSTVPQEGKSMVSANLACTLAQSTQQRVLLLEGDLRRPSLSKMFGLGRNPGLSESLQGERSLVRSVYHLEGPGLWILPSGSAPSNALELLQSGKLSALMDQLAMWFDWMIIDSPPALPLADTSVWMRLADGILLITRPGITEKRQLRRGIEALDPKKLIGAILNSSKHSADNYYYYSSPASASPSEGTSTS
jgi:capsular exopolysaccharide synthesis family protein